MDNSRSSSFSSRDSRANRCRTCKQDLPTECYCHYPVTIQVSGTERNPGRRFLSCPDRRCNFFIWVDKPPQEANAALIDELLEKLQLAEFEATRTTAELAKYKLIADKTSRSSRVAWLVIWGFIFAWCVRS